MTINKTKEGNEAVLAISGRLDTITAPELEEEMGKLESDVTALTFDLEKLDYISSAGLRVLLAFQKKMSQKGSMKVCHVGETVMEIFDVTGFADFLTIE